jgi:hypothetical protein
MRGKGFEFVIVLVRFIYSSLRSFSGGSHLGWSCRTRQA